MTGRPGAARLAWATFGRDWERHVIELRYEAILAAAVAKVEEPVIADQAPSTPTPIADQIFRCFLST